LIQVTHYPDENMDALLAKYFAGETSAGEDQQVYTWIEKSDENLQRFEAYMQIWNDSRQIPQLLDINEDEAWQKFRKRFIGTPVVSVRSRSHKLVFFQRAAAAVILLLAGFWCVYFLLPNNTAKPVTFALATLNAVKTDTLPDRSVVTLNKNAELSYTEKSKQERTVQLKGEAFFSVTPNKERPFMITAGEVLIKVVGTSFNVKAQGDLTEVIVRSGVVQVQYKEQILELYPGEKAMIERSGSVLKKTIEEDVLYNYYVSKTFICDNTPLWKLVEKLNEVYGAHIIIRNKDLSNLPLNVTFNEETLERILEVIKDTLMVSVSHEGDTIAIY